ncbi:MAG: hypothetical protein FWC47_01880 [Oscillospiraceae bacterium]|nr:hypothetical protein [Oscillospiraceae bacterium]
MDIENLFGSIFNSAMNMKNQGHSSDEEINNAAESSAKSIFNALPNEDILKGLGVPVSSKNVSENNIISLIKDAIVGVFQGVISGRVKSIDDAKNVAMQSAMKPENLMGFAGDFLGGFFKK